MLVSPTELDERVLDWVMDHRTEPWLTLARIITITGNALPMALATLVVVIVLATRGYRVDAVFVGAGAALGNVAMVGLKHLFKRERPPEVHRLVDIDTFSFPSGHAMMSMIIFGLFAVVAYGRLEWVRRHRLILLIAPIWSIAIGITRVYLGVHWTTDVLVGWVLGVVWVGLCVVVMNRYEVRRAVDPVRG